MALMKAKPSEIPPDGIILSRNEALNYQFKILSNWKDKWDIFGFKYSAISLGAATAYTGIYLNNYYRKKFHLLNYGKLSMYLPNCAIPALICYFIHMQMILPELILQETPCAVCIEMRASAIQSAVGSILPSILTPLSAFAMANRYSTYDIPYLHKEPRKVFQLYKSFTKPIGNVLFAIFVGHALLASVVTYSEAKSISTVNRKLAELEYNLEHGLEE